MAIVYSPKTLKQAIDQIMVAASQHKTAINFDEQTAILFVNRAVREVQAKTLPYKDWAWGDTIAVTNNMQLPLNFIRPIRLLVSAGGSAPYREARFVDIEDFYSLSNWQRKQTMNGASAQWPIYTIWGPQGSAVNTPTVQSNLRIYIAPYTNAIFPNQTGTAPTGYTYYTGSQLAGQLDCYTVPIDLSNPASTLPVPYEYEGLVMLYALSRVYYKVENYQKLQETQKQTQAEQMNLRKRFAEKRQTEKVNLEALMDADPVFPQRGK